MFRLLGFLIGSALSVAAILFITGVPRFHLEDPAIDQRRFDEAVEKLMARRLSTEPLPEERIVSDMGSATTVSDPTTQIGDEQTTALEPLIEAATSVARPEQNPIDTGLEISEPDFDTAPLSDMQWYSFWNPFRSKLAASGFVSRLEKVTGLDYRVVKVKTGVYEVAFAYSDDGEKRSKISLISMATGLDLPDS